VTAILPDFHLFLYKFPTGQPFSDVVSNHFPLSASVVSVLSFSSVGILLILGGIDLFTSALSALFLLFDPSISAMSRLTIATAIQLLLLFGAFHCANEVLARAPPTIAWYVYQTVSWLFATFSIFFNLDILSVPITLFCQYLTASAILSLGEQTQKKPTAFVR
jgi:hypothetical protein